MTSSQSYPVVLCKDLRMILLSALTPMCARCMSLAPHRMSSLKRKPKYWVIDSGASVHCVSDPSLLTSVYYKHPPVLIKVADNRTLHAHAVGTAVLPLLDNRGKTHLVTLHNVIYHPNFHTNLVSVRRLWQDNNITCLFDPHNFMQDISTGVNPYFGAKLSSDLCGPFPKSLEGYVYMLNVVDACTNTLRVYFLRSKSSTEVLACFQVFLREFKPHLPTDPGMPIRWHTDNGGEFLSTDLNDFCAEFAVRRSFSTPYAPPQNAHAERMWGIILRPMRVMLAASHIPDCFWPYAARHACLLHNLLPSSRLAGEMSPYRLV